MAAIPNAKQTALVLGLGSALLFIWCTLASSAERAAKSSLPAVPSDHAEQMAKGLEIFKKEVGPILAENCAKCHGGEKTKGEFDLTSREGLLKGGADGVDVVAGKAKESRLIRLLSHAEEPHMPSKAPKLSDEKIARIAAWIDAGAPYDKPLIAKAEKKTRDKVTDEDRKFWSFQPLQKPKIPQVKNASWCRNDLDRFIVAKLEEKKLRPNPAIERRKLI